MSTVPTTHKEISPHPSALAVTSPTDPTKKQQDIDQKLKLYGVFAAFKEGKLPSNHQIDATLDWVLGNSPVDQNKLSREGRKLISDFQNIIKTAKRMVAEKNEDELFQNFIWHTRHVDLNKGGVNTAVNKDDAQQHADEAIEHLRTLGKLIFTNSEARKLLKDIGILGRDVAADGLAKAAEVARPEDHQLENVDEAAPHAQWEGPNGEVRGKHEAVPDTGLAEKRDQLVQKKEEVKSQANDVANQAQGHAENIAQAADNAQQQQGGSQEDRAAAAKEASKDQAREEKQKAQGTINDLKQKLSIPDEHKDKAKEQLEKAKDYAKDKFPEERRDKFIYRLKKVVVENQSHRDYQEAIEFFLDKAEHYGGAAKDAHSQVTDKAADVVKGDSDFKRAQHELTTLLERFANGQSSKPIFDAIDQLYTDAKNDDELRKFFKRCDTYIRNVLQEPGYIMKDECDREGKNLQKESERFFHPNQGKYAGHKDNLFDSIETFFTAYADDALNVQLGNDVKKLTTDLLYDGDGNLKYKSHLWNDVRSVILPALGSNLGYVPIPRIEYTDPMIDVVIENLTLESANLIPNQIEIDIKNYFKVSPYDAIRDVSKHDFTIGFSQIQADLKDVAFFVKKKQGFPKLQDSGIADVVIAGNGLSGKIHLSSSGDKDRIFNVRDVSVNIDTLKFAIRESKHSFLISLFKPLAQGLIRKGVAKAIEAAIRSGLEQLDAQLVDIQERVEAAQEEEGVGKFDAVKRSFDQKKQEAQHKKAQVDAKNADSQFQITSNRDSKIINWESPKSIIGTAAEKDKAARSTGGANEGWKSPAFDIVRGSAVNAPGGSSSTSRSAVGTGAAAATGAAVGTAGGLTAVQQLKGDHSASSAPQASQTPSSATQAPTGTPIASQYATGGDSRAAIASGAAPDINADRNEILSTGGNGATGQSTGGPVLGARLN